MILVLGEGSPPTQLTLTTPKENIHFALNTYIHMSVCLSRHLCFSLSVFYLSLNCIVHIFIHISTVTSLKNYICSQSPNHDNQPEFIAQGKSRSVQVSLSPSRLVLISQVSSGKSRLFKVI